MTFLVDSIQAGGGTRFVAPLTSIYDIIYKRELRELVVVFITDGEDNNRQETKEYSKKLKEALTINGTNSTFLVIGITTSSDTGVLSDI
jgi:Mg-chelatase subunit ChlD